jgi:hypothetical protein
MIETPTFRNISAFEGPTLPTQAEILPSTCHIRHFAT